MSLKLIPFNAEWVAHDTLDLHAIYRRPVRDPHTFEIARDEHGFVNWDLTTGLPIHSHAKWLSKGFEYVTLESTQDVIDAATPTPGLSTLASPEQYLGQNPRTRGPWDSQAYIADQQAKYAARLEGLKRRIAAHGPDAAEEFEQQQDPGYVLPECYRRQAPAPDAHVEAPPRRRGRPRKSEIPEAVAV